MIDPDELKQRALRFARDAKLTGLGSKWSRLLDVFAYAHYMRAYSALMCDARRSGVDPPQSPPQFLHEAADRFAIDAHDLLAVLESHGNPALRVPEVASASAPMAYIDLSMVVIGAQALASVLPRFEVTLPADGCRDFFCHCWFGEDFEALVDELAEAPLPWPASPEFVKSACTLHGVNTRYATALIRQLTSGIPPHPGI